MSRYAADTSVSSEKSRAEIESTLRRYGAVAFGYMSNRDSAMVGFQVNARRVKFHLPMPDPTAREFTHTPGREIERSRVQADAAWEQACRQRWRALALCIKAKLEAVEADITSFDAEFLAHIVLPDGATVGERALPAIEQAYATGTLPPLLGKF